MIGYTASFLTQCNYFNLSACNRSIYLGCNTPNLLQELNLFSNNIDFTKINLELYPSIKDLTIKLDNFNKILKKGQLNQLQCLCLNGWESIDEKLQEFTDNNFIKFKNITSLNCVEFNAEHITFTKFLSQFTNLQHLVLNGVDVDFDVNAIKNVLCNLTELLLYDLPAAKVRELVNAFGDKLEYLLLLDYGNAIDQDFTSINFIIFFITKV